MAGHAQLKFVMTECSKTQIRLTGPINAFELVVLTNLIVAGFHDNRTKRLHKPSFTPLRDNFYQEMSQ